MEVLEEIAHRENYEDYRSQTMLLRQEALIASGLAKLLALHAQALLFFGIDKKVEKIQSMPENTFSRFGENSAENLIENAVSVAGERALIEKINDESTPVYDGLSNEEAKNAFWSTKKWQKSWRKEPN